MSLKRILCERSSTEEYRVQRIVQSLKGFFCGEEQVLVMGRLLHGHCISICKALKGPKSPGVHIFPQLIKDSSLDIISIQVLYSVFCNMYRNSLHPMQVLLVSVFAGSARENFLTFTSSLYLRLSFLTFL